MALNQLRVSWTGFTGAPGVTTLYTENVDPTSFVAAVKAFLNSVKQFHPTGLTWHIPHSGKVIDLTTGEAVDVWSISGADETVGGTTSSTYSAPTGYCINWHTGSFISGRELVGRTFMVPAVAGAFSSDGSLEASNLATMQTAATTLADTDLLAVYSRHGAASGTVHSGTVPDKAVVLRSRRD